MFGLLVEMIKFKAGEMWTRDQPCELSLVTLEKLARHEDRDQDSVSQQIPGFSSRRNCTFLP